MARIPTPIAKLPPPKEGPSLMAIVIGLMLCFGSLMAIAVYYKRPNMTPAAVPAAQPTQAPKEDHQHFAQDDPNIVAGVLEDRESGCQYITVRRSYSDSTPFVMPRAMKDGTQFCGYGRIQKGEVK